MSENNNVKIAAVGPTQFGKAGACADGELKENDAGRSAGLCVTVRNVSVAVGGKRRLNNISLEISKGELVALFGPSGCGKSILVRCIAGLVPLEEGDVLLNGHNIAKGKRNILLSVAYLPRSMEDTLYADMTVEEAMDDFVQCHFAKDNRLCYAAKLGDVDLDYGKLKSTPVRQLSTVMKRRFALALALLREPQLLLFDEPTADLDPVDEASFMELLRRIAGQGLTVICATHVLSCLDKCNKVAALASGGGLVFFGVPSAALEHFAAADWLSVYRTLDPDGFKARKSDGIFNPDDFPVALQKASFGLYFRATFRRLWRNVCSMRNALFFVGIPVGIAYVLAWTFGDMFEFRRIGMWETECFCMAVVMFCLGMLGSMRSLVSERIPRRCLDFMRGVPLVRYFSVHVAVVAVSSFVQAILFVTSFFSRWPDLIDFGWWSLFPIFLFVLAMTCFAGGCVGLVISAWAKKKIQAVGGICCVVILAFVLNLLSEPTPDLFYGGEMRGVSSWMVPTIHAQKCLRKELWLWYYPCYSRLFLESEPGEKFTPRYNAFLLVPAIAHPMIFLSLAFFFQKRQEEKWNGLNVNDTEA